MDCTTRDKLYRLLMEVQEVKDSLSIILESVEEIESELMDFGKEIYPYCPFSKHFRLGDDVFQHDLENNCFRPTFLKTDARKHWSSLAEDILSFVSEGKVVAQPQERSPRGHHIVCLLHCNPEDLIRGKDE